LNHPGRWDFIEQASSKFRGGPLPEPEQAARINKAISNAIFFICSLPSLSLVFERTINEKIQNV